MPIVPLCLLVETFSNDKRWLDSEGVPLAVPATLSGITLYMLSSIHRIRQYILQGFWHIVILTCTIPSLSKVNLLRMLRMQKRENSPLLLTNISYMIYRSDSIDGTYAFTMFGSKGQYEGISRATLYRRKKAAANENKENIFGLEGQ